MIDISIINEKFLCLLKTGVDIEIYQAKIKITQLPSEIPMVKYFDRSKEIEVFYPKSFLCDPFNDFRIYGLEITCGLDFSWTFFFCEKSKNEALAQGHAFLNHLRLEFPGLDGEVSVSRLPVYFCEEHHERYGFMMPRLPLEISIINKFISLFNMWKFGEIHLFLFWQKATRLINSTNLLDLIKDDDYFVRIFLTLKLPENQEELSEVDKIKWNSIIRFLISSIRNSYGRKTFAMSFFLFPWILLIYRNLKNITEFYEEHFKLMPYLEVFMSKFPYMSFTKPFKIDCHFPENIPIPRVQSLRNQRYTLIASNKRMDKICIGKILNHGLVSSNDALIPMESLAKSMLIGGTHGTGKTYLLKQISKEFERFRWIVGVLYINIGKELQERYFQPHLVIKYDDLWIPYFLCKRNHDKCLQETASYLTASLGLREPVDKVLKKVMNAFIKVKGSLPDSPLTLFRGLKKWYKEHRYHDEYQTNILTAIENRVLSLFSDPKLEEIMSLNKHEKIPKWYDIWKKGNKVYIDLSSCNYYVKLLLVNAILQIIRALENPNDVNGLKSLIVIDEANEILNKPKDYFVNYDEYVARAQLEKIFTNILLELRSKGLGFILVSQMPSKLFTSATELPSIKVLFRLGESCIKYFFDDPQERDFLRLLKDRRALVLNGNNGDRYAIETIPFD